jgi:hypothetical protein
MAYGASGLGIVETSCPSEDRGGSGVHVESKLYSTSVVGLFGSSVTCTWLVARTISFLLVIYALGILLVMLRPRLLEVNASRRIKTRLYKVDVAYVILAADFERRSSAYLKTLTKVAKVSLLLYYNLGHLDYVFCGDSV